MGLGISNQAGQLNEMNGGDAPKGVPPRILFYGIPSTRQVTALALSIHVEEVPEPILASLHWRGDSTPLTYKFSDPWKQH